MFIKPCDSENEIQTEGPRETEIKESYTVRTLALQTSGKGTARVQSRDTKCLVCGLDLQRSQGKTSAMHGCIDEVRLLEEVFLLEITVVSPNFIYCL